MQNQTPTAKNIIDAHERIKPYINKTPVLQSEQLNNLMGCEMYFKCENLQKIGAFKARGGFNAALSLTKNEFSKGICTHSSGNHAQAVALAAKSLGIKAYIVMPHNAPKVKIEGVKSLGAEIIFCENNPDARQAGVEKIIAEKGAYFIHPFDNHEVITGQATAAKELLEEFPNLDYILAPVGGGGLLSGTALAVKYFSKHTLVLGCEPTGAADAVLSFETGNVEKAPFVDTVADGLMTHLSERTLKIIRSNVESILLAPESEILPTMKTIIQNLKIIIEPSSAVPVVALAENKALFQGKKLGIILTGGNLDFSRLT